MKKLIILILHLLIMSSFAKGYTVGGITQQQANAFVNEFIHRAFKDPYSIQDLSVGTPEVRNPLMGGPILAIPFECNSKNSFGAYTGIMRYEVLLTKYHMVNWEIDWKRIATIRSIQQVITNL